MPEVGAVERGGTAERGDARGDAAVDARGSESSAGSVGELWPRARAFERDAFA